jgi:hypothetical protein
LLVANFSFSHSNKKLNDRVQLNNEKSGQLSIEVYYLSTHSALSDTEIGMNSVTFGTNNTTSIQNVLDKALIVVMNN